MRTVAFALFLFLAPAAADFVELPRVAQLEEADDTESGLGLAENLLLQAELDGAKRLALRALAKDPGSQRALLVLCKVAVATEQVAEARDYSDRLLELDATIPVYHGLSAMASLYEGNPDQSASSFKRALELGEGTETRGQLAYYANSVVLAYHQAKKPGSALEACLAYIEEYPEEGNLYLTCSRLYREAEDFQNALEVAEVGLTKSPKFYSLYASIALAQANLGDSEASEAAFDKLKFFIPGLAKELRDVLDGISEDKAELKVEVR